MLSLKHPTLIVDGIEITIPSQYLKAKDIGKASVLAVFSHYLQSGVPTTEAYERTAKTCGFKSHSAIIKIVARSGNK